MYQTASAITHANSWSNLERRQAESAAGLVYVLDPPKKESDQSEAACRRALCEAVDAGGLERLKQLEIVELDSASAFLDRYHPEQPGCLVCPVEAAGWRSSNLLDDLRDSGPQVPRVVLCDVPDVASAVRIMRGGAFHLLPLSHSPRQLAEVVAEAVAYDRTVRGRRREADLIRLRAARMTPQQREVLRGIVRGDSNREIAHRLRIGLRTVETRRQEVARLLRAVSPADLIRMACQAGLFDEESVGAP